MCFSILLPVGLSRRTHFLLLWTRPRCILSYFPKISTAPQRGQDCSNPQQAHANRHREPMPHRHACPPVHRLQFHSKPSPLLHHQPTPAISITEVSIPDQRQEPGLQRSKSKWSRREIVGISTFKERREAKARAAAAMPEIDVVLPPLSPVVDEEFWRTGRYPTEPGMGVVHVVF
jgi:hypothetical protein